MKGETLGQKKNPAPYYCLVSTLNPETDEWAYTYRRYDLHIPKGLVQRARDENTDKKWVTYRFADARALQRTEADTMDNRGLLRMARCRLPAVPSVVQHMRRQFTKFTPGSWIYKREPQEQPTGTGDPQQSDYWTCTAVIDYFICNEPNVSDPYSDPGCTYTGSECVEYEYVEGNEGGGGDSNGGDGEGGSTDPGGNEGDPCEPDPDGSGGIPEGCEIDEDYEIMKIIFDPSFKNTKAECVYNKLNQNSTSFRDVINEFAGEYTTFDLKLFVGDLGDDYGTLNSSLGDNTFEMIIDQSGLSRTPLEIAGTFLHEGIHAEMRRFLYGATNTSTLPGFPGDFSSDWDNYILEKYGDLQDPVTAAEHQAMAEKYVGIIVDALQEFDNYQLEPESYEALAYVGLIDTETWGNLEQDKRDEIGANYQNLEDILGNRSKQCN